MSAELREAHPPQSADDVDDNLVQAVKTEIGHEVHNIQRTKEPVDPTQSDVLVQKHFPGLFAILLILVVVLLLAAMLGVWLFGRH